MDRVELAYLRYLLADDVPLFGLLRTAYGYVLLDTAGLEKFQQRLDGTLPWGPPDLVSRLPKRRTPMMRQIEADVRRDAIARSVPWGLARMLVRHLPARTSYVNVGHSNLTTRVFEAVKKLPDGQIAAMIHDVIPLEYPQFQRPGTVAPFAAKVARLAENADILIYNSEDTRHRAEARMPTPAPHSIVSHLGVSVPRPDPAALPKGLPLTDPYFVTVGTIEPRKNHAFLLDLWDQMGADAPRLFICGNRGWNNDAVFARLDALPVDGPVKELGGLSDVGLAALVEGAHGALFPSIAEGYGLPPAEALAQGTRVLCNNLQVSREILGEKAIYAGVSEGYLWISTIKKWAQGSQKQRKTEQFFPPTWEDHFKIVLRLI